MAFDPSYPHLRTSGLLNASASVVPALSVLTTSGLRFSTDTVFGGAYRVRGTVKRKDTPTNAPLRRKVWLIRENDMKVVAASWSDSATGEYDFQFVAGGYKYTVLSYDYEHTLRAVVADNLTAEAMP